MRSILMRGKEGRVWSNSTNIPAAEMITALSDAIGRYCSFCEQPLRGESYLFHKTKGVVAAGLSSADWNNLFLLCGDCRASVTDTFNPQGPYLWPDEYMDSDVASEQNPYVYTVADARYVKVWPTGEQGVSERTLVFVEANRRASAYVRKAQNTIDLFRLNGHFYNNQPADRVITVPPDKIAPESRMDPGYKAFQDALSDSRMDSRARAYQSALKAADYLMMGLDFKEPVPLLFESAVENMNLTQHSVGHWSTWVTAFWNSFTDKQIVRDIFFIKPYAPTPDLSPKRRPEGVDVPDEVPPKKSK